MRRLVDHARLERQPRARRAGTFRLQSSVRCGGAMVASVVSSAPLDNARSARFSSITTGSRLRMEVQPQSRIWSFGAAVTTAMKRSDGSDRALFARGRSRSSLAGAGRAIRRPKPNPAATLSGCFLPIGAFTRRLTLSCDWRRWAHQRVSERTQEAAGFRSQESSRHGTRPQRPSDRARRLWAWPPLPHRMVRPRRDVRVLGGGSQHRQLSRQAAAR